MGGESPPIFCVKKYEKIFANILVFNTYRKCLLFDAL